MIKKIINKLSKIQKVSYLFLIFFILFTIFVIPSLARLINRSSILTAPIWNGTIATQYYNGSGTIDDPYIISNGEELAYFSEQLKITDYQDTYFLLKNDISLNKGNFDYIDTSIRYTLDSQTYYIKEYTNDYYETVDCSGTKVGSINNFNALNNFKGTFNGSSFTINGLYMTNENVPELALFINFQGHIKNLYLQNALIYGGGITAGVVSSNSNGTLTNIIFDGKVIGNSNYQKTSSSILDNMTISLNNEKVEQSINLITDKDFILTDVTSSTLTGTYVVNSNNANVETTINGNIITPGTFSIPLGTNLLTNVPLIIDTTEIGEIVLSNLSYNISYKYGITAGITAVADNATYINTINKGDIYGSLITGGILGTVGSNVTINQSYNTGDIYSERIGAGLISSIVNNDGSTIVDKSYNSGIINANIVGGLIGQINNNTGTVVISNTFNVTDTYSVGTISNTSVTINNSYCTAISPIASGEVINSFIQTDLNNFYSREFLINNLHFTEFISNNDLLINQNNVWINIDEFLPILYIDDTSYSPISINTNFKSWNNFSTELNTLTINTSISFDIITNSQLIDIDKLYYCITPSNTSLTTSELTWLPYIDSVLLNEEGSYIIYAKAVDNNGNNIYVNSDIININFIKISMDDLIWSSINNDLKYVYVSANPILNFTFDSNLINVKTIKYYVSKNKIDINQLSNIDWLNYNSNIVLNNIGTYIVYGQITDIDDNITYLNTDYIVFDGYNEGELIVGRNVNSYTNTNYITNKSLVTLRFNYTSSHIYSNSYTHNLVSNILLPLGTKIKLFDNITNEMYEYEVTTANDIYNYNNSCNTDNCVKTATYPLTLFKEIGTGNISRYFVESIHTNNGEVIENYTVVLDFSNTNIVDNYENISLYMQINDTTGKGIISTLNSTIKKFNIMTTNDGNRTDASIYLNSTNSNNSTSNNISVTNISLNTGINYSLINNKKIIDTNYEDKVIGLRLKIVDANGVMVSRNYLKNFVFKINNQEYYPDGDNYIYINLNNGINATNKTLTVIIYEINSNLTPGDYTLIINNYVSYNGDYVNEVINNDISFPIKINDVTSNTSYKFDVNEINNQYIIDKSNLGESLSFNILLTGTFTNPNVRLSLYQKNDLTAYNQDYTLVNLQEYCSNELIEHGTNIYDINARLYGNLQLDLIANTFNNNGYKFAFELYDGNIKIGSIEKYFIAK